MSWITAFKVIPWAEVIAAAPGVAQRAKKMWAKARHGEQAGDAVVPTSPEARLQTIEAAVVQLHEAHTATAELVKSVAEQNAQLVAAIEVFRARVRMLATVAIVTSVVAVGVSLWALYA